MDIDLDSDREDLLGEIDLSLYPASVPYELPVFDVDLLSPETL